MFTLNACAAGIIAKMWDITPIILNCVGAVWAMRLGREKQGGFAESTKSVALLIKIECSDTNALFVQSSVVGGRWD